MQLVEQLLSANSRTIGAIDESIALGSHSQCTQCFRFVYTEPLAIDGLTVASPVMTRENPLAPV